MKTYREYGIDAPDTGAGEYRTVCPQCEPSRSHKGNRDLSVNLAAKTWHCHHCDWSGGIPAGDGWTPRREARPEPRQEHQEPDTPATFVPPPMSAPTPEALAFLASRGISQEVVAWAGVTSARMWSHKAGHEVEAVAFPALREGRVVNVKLRAVEGKDFSQARGGDQTALFGRFEPGDCLVFTEGELDTLSVMEAGYHNAVSAPNGAPPVGARSLETKLSFIESNRGMFDAAGEIVLAMDKDAPGLAFEKLVAERIGFARCATVTYPAGCKDANDALLKHGREALSECLRNAKPWPVEGVTTFAEHMDEIFQFQRTRGAEGLFSTGIPRLDQVFQLQLGTLNVLTGVPSHGKSELLDQLIVNTAAAHRWSWAVFSPENYPLPNHFQKLAEKLVQKPFFRLGELVAWGIPEMSEQETKAAAAFLSQRVKLLTAGEASPTLESILARVEVCVARDKVAAFVFDPWNEIEHCRPPGLTETEYISLALSRIRNFARSHNVAAWIVAHPAKLQKDKNGAYPVPTAYDISGSAHWRNKADAVLCVWRDVAANDGKVEIHIQKVRNKNAGRAGKVVVCHWTRANGVLA